MFNQTTAIITVLLVILSAVLPRKHRLVPFIVAACFVPTEQRFIIGGLDFTVLRILLVAVVLRIWLRGETVLIRWNRFDYILLSWITCGAIVYSLQMASMAAIIYKCGVMFDLIGSYWLFRQCIRSWADVKFVITVFAVCLCVFAPLIALEWMVRKTPFVALGRLHTTIRAGRYRCQGSLAHAIEMGLFCATLFPLFASMGIIENKKILYWGAAVLSVFCVKASASATPLMVLLMSFPLFALFKWRYHSKVFVRVLLGGLLCLHIIMEGPVWALIHKSKVLIPGSSGWHRYDIIDKTIRHFSEWALLGTRDIGHWGYGLHDAANRYVIEAVRGGFITFALFVTVLFIAVKTAVKFSQDATQKDQQLLAWAISVLMVGHCLGFIGCGYPGQLRMLLYLNFAFVGFIYEMATTSFVSTQLSQFRSSLLMKRR